MQKKLKIALALIIVGFLVVVIALFYSSSKKTPPPQNTTDSEVKTTVVTLREAAEVFYANHNNSYKGICAASIDDPSGVGKMLHSSNYPEGTDIICNSTAVAYAAEATLADNTSYWCVDSSGVSATTTKLIGTSTKCKI